MPERSLTILDRFCEDYGQLFYLWKRGEDRHWLLRARKNLKWRVLKKMGVVG
jgi:hypothetical protein